MDTKAQADSLTERRRAVIEAGRQLEPKLPGFWGRIILLFRGGKCGMCEVNETFETENKEKSG